MNIMHEYYKKISLDIGKNKFKYILLWVDGFVDYILCTFKLISIELLKNEMPKYYQRLTNKKR